MRNLDFPIVPFAQRQINPLSVIAKDLPNETLRALENISLRQTRAAIATARADSLADMTRSHCATIASAVVSRPDMNNFRIVTTDTEGSYSLFGCRVGDKYRRVATELNMW